MSQQSVARRALEEMKQQASETGEPSHDTVAEFQSRVTIMIVRSLGNNWERTADGIWVCEDEVHTITPEGWYILRYQDTELGRFDTVLEAIEKCEERKYEEALPE